MMYAASGNSLEIVKLLFEYEKGIKSNTHETTIHFAIRGKND